MGKRKGINQHSQNLEKGNLPIAPGQPARR